MNEHPELGRIISAFPALFKNLFFNQLNHLINYSPTIDLMGKTGVGKSSLINVLFQSSLSPVSDVSGCIQYDDEQPYAHLYRFSWCGRIT